VALAVSAEGALLYGLALFGALLIGPGAVTLLKGQRDLFLAGLLAGGLVWWITAFRLARPDSWWARRFYEPAKLERARRRYLYSE
jgi:hypothetical protein